MKRFFKNTLRTLRACAVFLSLLIVLALWGIRSEWAQNRLVPIVETLVSDALGVHVEVGAVNIDLPAHLVLGDLKMLDKQQQPIFAIKQLRLGFTSFSIIRLLIAPRQVQTLKISHLTLVEPEAHLYRSRRDSTWNYAFLSSTEPDTTPSKPLKLQLEFPVVELRGGQFSMVDSTKADSVLAPGRQINFSNLNLQQIITDAAFHYAPDQRMYGHVKGLSLLEANSQQMIESLSSEYLIQLKPRPPSHLSICLENTRIQVGRTHLDLDAELEDIRPDSAADRFHPVFAVHFRPSTFDFGTLDRLLPRAIPLAKPLSLAGFVYGDLHNLHSDSLDIGLMEHTRLRTTLTLSDYTSGDDLRFKLGLIGGTLSFEELQALLPSTQVPLHGIVQLEGPISGSLAQLKAPNLHVAYMDHTRLLVDARLFEYTKGDDIFMDIKFQKSKFSFGELKQLLPTMNLPVWLSKFGTCGIDGKFLGVVNDFVVNADMTSAYGNVSSNLHLTLPPKSADIAYDGFVSTQNLNLDGLQADLPISSRYLNFEGKIKGHGTEAGKIMADIDGKVHNSDIEGFHIDDAFTKEMKIRGNLISGEVDVVDAQGDASVTLTLDVPPTPTPTRKVPNPVRPPKHYVVIGDVKRLDLAHYGVMPKDSVFLTAVVNIDVGGKELEDYTGKMRFLQANLSRKGSKDSLQMSNVVLSSKLDTINHNHVVRLRSSVADMDLVGHFRYVKVYNVIDSLAHEAKLYINNDDSLTNAYYAAKKVEHDHLWLRDTLRTKAELNHVLSFFQVPLYLRPGTELRATFEHGAADELDIEIRSDSIGYSTVGMKGDSISLSLMKDGTQNFLLGHARVLIRELRIGKNLHFDRVSFEPNADDTEVDYFLRASQPQYGSEYIISAQTHFMDNGEINSQIRSQESKITIRGKTWQFAGENSIDHYYEKPPSLANVQTDSVISRYHIKGLRLYNEAQEILLGGVISKDRKDLMNVDIRNLDIGDVLAVLDTTKNIDGTLQRATFGVWNIMSGQPSIFGSGEVQNFSYHTVDSIGIKFWAGWPYVLGPDYAGMRIVLGKWGQDSLITKGWYNVANDSLHFDTDSSSIQLSWVEPFVEGILSQMKGHVSLDHFKIRGTSAQPDLKGVARLSNTSFKVDYLNSVFRIGSSLVNFDHERIDVDNIMVLDTLHGSAVLHGSVYLADTNGPLLDLRVDQINDLLLFDTRKKDNELFYGHIVLDGGWAKVTGYLSAPIINARVSTGDATWLDIPISGYTSANRLDFVNFIQKGDTLSTIKKMDFGGMQMSITVDARDNARVRLIFDEFVGDMIEAWGEGSINIELNKSGEFNMFGAYTLTKGDYHFTLENVLNKKFIVKQGGRIVWNGDPIDAQVNLDAVYKVNADISSLVPNAGGGNRVPVEVVMHMKGSLLAPEITLELMLDQLTDQDMLGLASYFRGVQYDEQELNKQVVSLLLFGRFAPTGTAGGSSANISSSISELVSNQVNHWLSQAFNDPKVGVEVKSNEFQDVNVLLRASLFHDRVTVERNGTLIGNTNGNLSIGDLSVLIKVLPKADTTGNVDPKAGQLVMEIFNHEDFSITSTNNVSRGTGLFYKKDFDRLSDFLKRRRAQAPKPK